MEQHTWDLFISHSSSDNAYAKELRDILLEKYPDMKIWLDLDKLDEAHEWKPAMLKAVENSKYLIFVASDPEKLLEGRGWLYREVTRFSARKASRHLEKRSHLNVAYCGIVLSSVQEVMAAISQGERSGEYGDLYQGVNLLCDIDSLSSAKERIYSKLGSMLNMSDDDIFCAEMLDKTKAFAEKRAREEDSLFSLQAIDKDLLPPLQTEERQILDEAAFQTLLKEKHLALLGNEGGSGKTTLLTYLYYTCLADCMQKNAGGDSMVPIYVDGKMLAAVNGDPILRYLAKTLYDESTAMTELHTSDKMGKMVQEFKSPTDAPRFLILVDGYNEIPQGHLEQFHKELKKFRPGGEYCNVRLVVAGRDLDDALPESDFARLTLRELPGGNVKKYLEKHGLLSVGQKVEATLFQIISIPMYLKMYTDSAMGENVHTKTDLLNAFLTRQEEKDAAADIPSSERARFFLFARYLLPLVAHRMVMRNKGESSFVLSTDQMEEIAEEARHLLGDRIYKKYYGEEYRSVLKTGGWSELDEFDVLDALRYYLSRVCKLLRRNSEGDYEFIHQIYRDFFCARFVAEDICRSGSLDVPCDSLCFCRLSDEIRNFVVEILGESAPSFDAQKENWDYSCNEASNLAKLPENARKHGLAEDRFFVANMVDLLKAARKGDLSGLDFSLLDFRLSDLRSCIFSRQDAKGNYATSFEKAFMDQDDLFCQDHFAPFRAVAVNKERLASADASGVLKIWKRNRVKNEPEKIISGVDNNLLQMLFTADGSGLYLMTAHTVAHLPLPEESFSEAKVEVLFETPKHLRRIYLDKEGKLLFTTSFNPFNPKPLSDPEAENTHNFFGLSTTAAFNEAGTKLALGEAASSNYTGLHLFEKGESGDWQEIRFGYAPLVEECILAMEQVLRKYKLYHHFPNDGVVIGYALKDRRSFFFHLQLQLEDRTHDFEAMPSIALDRIYKELGRHEIGGRAIRLFANQRAELEAVVKEYEEKILQMMADHPYWSGFFGRRIESLDFFADSEKLLFSAVNKHYKKNHYDSNVLELNVTTLQARPVARFADKNPLKAWYFGEEIVVLSPYRMTLYDGEGRVLDRLSTKPKKIFGFAYLPGDGVFYAISDHFVYAFDRDLRCVSAYNNCFGTHQVHFLATEEGGRYLVKTEDVENRMNAPRFLDLNVGIPAWPNLPLGEAKPILYAVEMEGRSFKMSGSELVMYEDDRQKDLLEISYKLLVTGCSFKGVQGSVAEERTLRQLARFGALTDLPEIEKAVGEEAEEMTFTPSDVPFVMPDLSTTAQPFVDKGNEKFAIANTFNDAVGGNNLYQMKAWNLIRWGSYAKNALEGSDYSILEWVGRLELVTSKMIYLLMEAGLVQKPSEYNCHYKGVSRRMVDTLHASYKLLSRFDFFVGEEGRNQHIYALSPIHGRGVLARTSAVNAQPRIEPVEMSEERAREKLALNSWFCHMAFRYKGFVKKYLFDREMKVRQHYRGKRRIGCYLLLGRQPFFAEGFRASEEAISRVAEKVERTARVAAYYPYITHDRLRLGATEKPPILVFVGENQESCRALYDRIKEVAPGLRKIFTTDALLACEEALSYTHFEFVGEDCFGVDLDSLL